MRISRVFRGSRILHLPPLAAALFTLGLSSGALGQQSTADPAAFVGAWRGTLSINGGSLRLSLAVRRDAAAQLSGVLTSLDQGNAEIPGTVELRHDSLVVAMPLASASFTAALTSGRDSLRGTFEQGGGAFPLVLQRVAGSAAALSGASAAAPRTTTAPARDVSPHRSIIVPAAGVRIHALDWGGKGPALVFIPGMGNTAHVFDDFAPRFTDHSRVVGITRVGFGESEQPVGHGYELSARVAQITAVLDSLGIRRAVLVGHSLGGDELTAFAGAHPERTAGLIYLDAAYDHSQVARWQQAMGTWAAGAPLPKAADFGSASAFQQFQQRSGAMQMPLGELLASFRYNEAGAIVGQLTTPQVMMATMAAIEKPDYAKVHAPALAIYSDWTSAADIMPWLRADTAANTRATAALAVVRADQAAERLRFAREVNGAKVESLRANHYEFMSNTAETEQMMRAFLTSLPADARR